MKKKIAAGLSVFLWVFSYFYTASAEPRTGGVLIVAHSNSPRHLNPAVQSGTPTGIPGAQLFAAPLRFDADWNPHPYLAESWEWSGDGLSFTLNLRAEARFHDGHPITSEDVAFSIETIKANHPFKTMFGVVERVETPDPLTAVFRLSRPHPALMLALSSQLGVIIPKHIYGDGQDMKTHPRNSQNVVGSGPFRLLEFKPGEHIIMERNPDYFLPGPYLDKIIFKITPDSSGAVIGMENEDFHFAPSTNMSLRDTARLHKLAHLISTTDGYEAIGALNWLAFNLRDPKLEDKRVRQAICYAIDRSFINEKLHVGQSSPATGPIVPGSPYYAGSVNHYDVDLTRAKALLAEAGAGELELQVDYFPGYDEQQKTIAEYLRAQLKKIGVKVQVRASADFPAWANRISNWDFQMTMDNVYNWGDPVIGVHRTYQCDNRIKGVIWTNTQGYCNPRVDSLLAEAGVTLDRQKRAGLYRKAQEIIVDEAPICFINVDPLRTVYHTGLGNPPLSIWGASAPLDEVYWENPPASANP